MTSSVDTLASKDVKKLLSEKYILILGDSVVRGLYKDLIKFSNSDDLLSEEDLRVKGENRFYGDRLINGGVQKGLTNGVDYEEVREYSSGGLLRIRFYFLTRSYSPYMRNVVFNDIKNQAVKPDIIIMNSCVWDISRYGIFAMKSYQRNIDRIMGSFRQMLPNVLFLWLSALPVSNTSKGGVIVSSAEYIRPILPGLIRDGNFHCSQMCDIHGVLYIDFHTIFSTMLHLRRPDGIHWCAIGNRIMTEIILNHVKAYYHGAKHFQCPLLRGELNNKINAFKQHCENQRYYSKKNYLNYDLSDDDDDDDGIEKDINILQLKRKRNSDDDEKENDRYQRKVVITFDRTENEQRKIVIKQSVNESEIKSKKLINNQTIKFDHEYCDIMYDNEYEGLHLSHFSSCDIDSMDEIDNFSSLNNTEEGKVELPIDNIPEVDIKPFENLEPSIPIPILNKEEINIAEPNYIILSSDDEEETTTTTHAASSSSSSPSVILPIYLLNHL